MNNLFSLKNKKAILTGAAGFFGTYFAKALLDSGLDKIYLIDKNSSKLDALAQELNSQYSPSRIAAIELDQYDHESTAAGFAKILAQDEIDILINNSFDFSKATGFNDPAGRLETVTFNQIDKSFESGVYWPLQATQVFSRQVNKREKPGTVINIGSMYSLISPHPDLYTGRDYFNPPGYSLAKSAVIALTRYTAAWCGPRMRANALLPGAIPNIETKSDNSEQNRDDEFMGRLVSRTLLKRVGHPKDLIGALIFLASDASSYMTGQTVVIDGGWVIT